MQPSWDYLRNHQDLLLQVAEVGFGRGFNIAELLRRARLDMPQKSWQISAFEPQPEGLEPWGEKPDFLADWLPWWGQASGFHESIEDRWKLQIHTATGQQAEIWPRRSLHLILLDLFSPGRHPEQWKEPLFENLSAAALPGAQLTSYSCARLVRDRLQRRGWETQILRAQGQRDTLHAVFHPERSTGHVRINP
ncbi:MAG: MnmC family methyltransferase [Planctomycetota bacterium]|nr:MnmC family methyltransferase [Planctomycetota bacterium]